MGYRVAVVGATGAVGREMLKTLAERRFPVDEVAAVASGRSTGQEVSFGEKQVLKVRNLETFDFHGWDLGLFSPGASVSAVHAPRAAAAGCVVIDNTSQFRMEPDIPLVVPEVNPEALRNYGKRNIIANPNCSTIQMVVALNPLHKRYGIKRIVVSTYQSVTGTGKKAVDQLMGERGKAVKGDNAEYPMAYKYPIDLNVIPQIDVFLDNGYTKEEMKMVNETRKIMSDDSIRVTATTVRIPVMGGHSESVNVEFAQDFDLAEVRALLEKSPGVIVVDDPANAQYPMPKDAHERDEVFVGRLRRDETQPNTLNMWIVSDNLRKGAATNAVQIAEYLAGKGML